MAKRAPPKPVDETDYYSIVDWFHRYLIAVPTTKWNAPESFTTVIDHCVAIDPRNEDPYDHKYPEGHGKTGEESFVSLLQNLKEYACAGRYFRIRDREILINPDTLEVSAYHPRLGLRLELWPR